jgi:hypothetical protein
MHHSEPQPGRWIAGNNGPTENHVISTFTDHPHRHALMHASQSDLATIVGAILDARATWDSHTSNEEIQYQIERAINLVPAPEVRSVAESPSNAAAQAAFRQKRENNGLYITQAWIKPKDPNADQMCRSCSGSGDNITGLGFCSICRGSRYAPGAEIPGKLIFADGQKKEKCDFCNGRGTTACSSCEHDQECEQCDGYGYTLETTSDPNLNKYPQCFALRRHGSEYAVIYEFEESASAALATMKEYPATLLTSWFSRPDSREFLQTA